MDHKMITLQTLYICILERKKQYDKLYFHGATAPGTEC